MPDEEQTPKLNSWFIYGLIVFLVIILVLSAYPSIGFKIETTQLLLIGIIVVLLLFRYFDVIEIIGVLKLKKEVQEIKNETKEIRKAQMSIMQTLTVSQNARASSYVYINPLLNQAAKDAEEEAEALLEEIPTVAERDKTAAYSTMRTEIDRIRQHINQREYSAAFLLIRRKIDGLLEDILGVETSDYKGFYDLLRKAENRDLISHPLAESILSVRRFANIAIHLPLSAERELSPLEVERTVNLGMRVIAVLESIKSPNKK